MIDINGELYDENDLVLSPLDASVYYGFSVYETLYIKNKKVAFFDEHLLRLKTSCDFFNIQFPDSIELKNRIKKLIENDKISHGRLRVITSPGNISSITNSKNCNTFIRIEEIKQTPTEIKLTLSSVKKPYPPIYPSNVKISANYFSLMSYIESKKKGFDEGLMVTSNNIITEGSYCNIFWSRKDKLYTPNINCSILEGVTRSKIVEICKNLNFKIEEGIFKIDELETVDNIFISSSTRGLLFVSQFDDKKFNNNLYNHYNEIMENYEKIQDDSFSLW
jgi:branched-subunit amino acid aminotransferase/4-amino-4-deoxychorismate lyase